MMTKSYMVKYLRDRGFNVEATVNSLNIRQIIFTISKDDVSVTDTFMLSSDTSMMEKIQQDFLNHIICYWEDKKRYLIRKGLAETTKGVLWTNTNPTIKNVIFNNPATIVFWSDNTKTVVKCQDGDNYDPEKGLAMAISKKFFGNKGNYYNEINKWMYKYNAKTFESAVNHIQKAIFDMLHIPFNKPKEEKTNDNNMQIET